MRGGDGTSCLANAHGFKHYKEGKSGFALFGDVRQFKYEFPLFFARSYDILKTASLSNMTNYDTEDN